MPLLLHRLPLFMSTASHRLFTPLTPSHRLLVSRLKIAPSSNVLFALRSNKVKLPRPLSIPTRDVHTVALNHELDIQKRFKILKDKLQELGFNYDNYVPGQFNNQICPKCQGGDAKEKSLSICIKEDGRVALWRCFRGKCGWSGVVQDGKMEKFNVGQGESQASNAKKGYRVISEEELGLEPLCKEVLAYLNERMISTETLRRNHVMQRRSGNQTVIAFTYRRNGILVSCKYRGIDKKFWQESNTERIFYGLDDIKNTSDIIIVEGEIDKLAMEEAGYRNCVSVPDGAPSKVSNTLPEQEKDTKYQYLWNCKEYLSKASRIILATDADAPGQALAEELARRLGKERCWRVKWPIKRGDEVCKDANEVLMYKGPDALREVIDTAELYPIRGLFKFSSFFQEIDDYYFCTNGYDRGISTGWRALHDLYNVVPGELTIISGVPNSGKSEWIDALMCNINKSERWTFALCSMENKVRDHARKLLEKYIGKPFFEASYGGSAERMSPQEFQQGKEWLSRTFHLIRCEDDCLPSVDWVLKLAKAAVLRYGVRGLVIDPYNELDHQRSSNQTETEYVSQMLTKIKRFAQHHSCHVWFVAHPKQLQNWGGQPPNLYDISGSAHFINKCDNGIVIHRNRDENIGPLDRVQVCVRKVRNKVIGNIGDAFLSYDRVTGRFMDLDDDTTQK